MLHMLLITIELCEWFICMVPSGGIPSSNSIRKSASNKIDRFLLL